MSYGTHSGRAPWRQALFLIAVAAATIAAAAFAATVPAANTGNGNGNDKSAQTQSTTQSGVKPSSTTDKHTHAAAGSDKTKLYGNGKTAGQIAQANGAGAGTDLYGPGNSQPHKVLVCTKNGKEHTVDVHALKSHRTAPCGQGTSGVAAASQTLASGTPALLVHKQERVGTAGTFVDGPVNAVVGETVFYLILVEDHGTTPLDVTLSDPLCDAGTLAPTRTIELNPGGTTFYTCSHLVTAADVGTLRNVATATGVVPGTASHVQGQSAAVAQVAAAGVLGANKTLTRGVHRTARAAPARAGVRAASFTG